MTTIDDFIEFFKSIPDKKWNVGMQNAWDGSHCALGHCNYKGGYAEGLALAGLFSLPVRIKEKVTSNGYLLNEIVSRVDAVAAVNNGETYEYRQKTPKQRILAYLNDAKNNAPVKEAQEIVNSLELV